MPYSSINDLPESVKNHLPKHALEIYQKAFNSAWEQYPDETTVHKVAWSAVKLKYKKGPRKKWIEK